MSLFEDFLTDFLRELLFGSIRWIGIAAKWIFYLGKKPIATIKQEKWNNRIGVLIFFILIFTIIIMVNKF
jgi:hypothetical protein